MIQQEILTALGIPSAVYDFCNKREKELEEQYQRIDSIAEANQAKVFTPRSSEQKTLWCARS